MVQLIGLFTLHKSLVWIWFMLSVFCYISTFMFMLVIKFHQIVVILVGISYVPLFADLFFKVLGISIYD